MSTLTHCVVLGPSVDRSLLSTQRSLGGTNVLGRKHQAATPMARMAWHVQLEDFSGYLVIAWLLMEVGVRAISKVMNQRPFNPHPSG
jgi:hypothetical protein